MKIVILIEPHGQTSNNLFQHIHFDAYCNINGAVFINPKFKFKFLHYKKRFFLLLFFGCLLNLKLIRKILIKTKAARYYKFSAPTKNNFQISYLTYVKGWKFKIAIPELYHAHYKLKFFEILTQEELFENKNHIYIGLHVRRGDYKDFANGRYYMSDEQYITSLLILLNQINHECKIFVFTNDSELDHNKYLNLPFSVVISAGSVLQDYYRLSRCDYIVGPSSTFTMWASYISQGRVKKLLVIDKFNYQHISIN